MCILPADVQNVNQRYIDWIEKLNYTYKILCPLLEFDYF